MANIIEKTGKSYNIFDKINNVWNKCSFWTHSNDVFYPDGKSATTKHGAINGITSDLSGEAEDVAASIKCVNQLNSSLSDIDKKVSFKPNYSNILKTITSTSASYTATQDCWVVGYVRAEGSGAGSDVKIDGLTCASAIFIGSGISMSGCGVTAFAPKGSTITTGLYGTYYLNVVGVM